MGRSLSLAAYLAFKRNPNLAQSQQGHMGKTRLNGPLVWFHLGQKTSLNAVVELAQRIVKVDDRIHFLLTCDDPIETDLPPYFSEAPLFGDSIKTANWFLDFWHPDVIVWDGGFLKPAVLHIAEDRGISNILLNANARGFSESHLRWFPDLTKSLLKRFKAILVETPHDKAHLRKLGGDDKKILQTGGLNDAAPILQCDEHEREKLAQQLNDRAVWLASCCSMTEIDMVIRAHKRGLRSAHRLLLVIVPKQSDVVDELRNKLALAGFDAIATSDNVDVDAFTSSYIADDADDLALWYRLATLTFIGGTISGEPDRNPFEAASLGSAILFGPRTGNFRQEFTRLERVGAAKLVRNTLELGKAIEELIAPHRAAEMAHAAWDESTKGAETTDFVKELIFGELDAAGAI